MGRPHGVSTASSRLPHGFRTAGCRPATQQPVDESSAECRALLAWLGAGPPPIFVGFGSMVFDGDAATATILAAAERADCRVLLQSGYSQLGGGCGVGSLGGWGTRAKIRAELPCRAFVVGPCAHAWLLPKVDPTPTRSPSPTLSLAPSLVPSLAPSLAPSLTLTLALA